MDDASDVPFNCLFQPFQTSATLKGKYEHRAFRQNVNTKYRIKFWIAGT